MAACTSRAAASILRFRSNCRVMPVDPRLLDEVISVTDAMRVNWRSSGVATDEAMISGLAPGKLAFTEIVGKSTCGKGETGKILNATAPARAIAAARRVVATGRRIKGAERLLPVSGVPMFSRCSLMANPPARAPDLPDFRRSCGTWRIAGQDYQRKCK